MNNGLVIGANDAHPLDVLLSTAKGAVQGDVRTSAGKAVQGTTVILIPPDSRAKNAALYRTATTDAQGHYTIENVAPGNDTVYAWESVKQNAYQNAEFLLQFAGRGKAVTVQAGPRSGVDMTVIPKDSISR